MNVRTNLRRLWLTFVFISRLAMPGLAREPALPGYEVKFCLLPSKVLAEDHEPTKVVKNLFRLQARPTKLRMMFLDDAGRDLQAEGWNIRFRDIEGKGKMELTYKRRYPVQGDDIESALAAAAQQGFDTAARNYDVEVEWGLRRKTLSFTRKEEVGGSGDAALPKLDAARQFALDKLPERLAHWIHDGWAKSVLAEAQLNGPVDGKRWTSRQDEIDDQIVLELWQIRKGSGDEMEDLLEVSFKKKDRTEAKASRDRLLELLRGQDGWLLEDDMLKTELILERYR